MAGYRKWGKYLKIRLVMHSIKSGRVSAYGTSYIYMLVMLYRGFAQYFLCLGIYNNKLREYYVMQRCAVAAEQRSASMCTVIPSSG